MVGIEYPTKLDDHTFSAEKDEPGLSLMTPREGDDSDIELGDLEEIVRDLTED